MYRYLQTFYGTFDGAASSGGQVRSGGGWVKHNWVALDGVRLGVIHSEQ